MAVLKREGGLVCRRASQNVFHGGDAVAELKPQRGCLPLAESSRVTLRDDKKAAVTIFGRLSQGGEAVAELKRGFGPHVFHGGDAVAELKVSIMSTPLVTSDPAIMLGKPVIAGTRIPVELILEKLAAGETVEELLLDYPQLTAESVSAALSFAVQVLRTDVVYPWPRQVA